MHVRLDMSFVSAAHGLDLQTSLMQGFPSVMQRYISVLGLCVGLTSALT